MATRIRLKNELFNNGACPDESAYAEVFDSTIGYDEDGIESPKNGNPLHIKAPDISRTALKITGSLEIQSHKNQMPYISSINENGLRIAAEVDAGGKNIGPNILLLPQNYTDPDQRGSMYLLFGDETKEEIPNTAIMSFQACYQSGYKELMRLNKNNVLLVPNGGNVGIGTETPEGRLVVAGGDISGGGMMLCYLFHESQYKDGGEYLKQYLGSINMAFSGPGYSTLFTTKIYIPAGTSLIAVISEYHSVGRNMWIRIQIGDKYSEIIYLPDYSTEFIYSGEIIVNCTDIIGLQDCCLFVGTREATICNIQLRRFFVYVKN